MTSLPRRILLATDGSEEAKLLAGPAVECARSTGSELHMVHLKPLPLTPPTPKCSAGEKTLGGTSARLGSCSMSKSRKLRTLAAQLPRST